MVPEGERDISFSGVAIDKEPVFLLITLHLDPCKATLMNLTGSPKTGETSWEEKGKSARVGGDKRA